MATTSSTSDAVRAAGPYRLPGTTFTPLASPSLGSLETSVWTVEIEPGTPASPHRVSREEIFVVLDGIARLTVAGAVREVPAGAAAVVPAGTEFSFANVGDGVLRAVCVLPVGGQAQLPGGEPFTPPWAA
jgi:quercetin dioxygenase-like cupin family protein